MASQIWYFKNGLYCFQIWAFSEFNSKQVLPLCLRKKCWQACNYYCIVNLLPTGIRFDYTFPSSIPTFKFQCSASNYKCQKQNKKAQWLDWLASSHVYIQGSLMMSRYIKWQQLLNVTPNCYPFLFPLSVSNIKCKGLILCPWKWSIP